MFEFDPQGLLVSPADTDNPDNHVTLHHDAGTKVSFAVRNVGTVTGQCTVGIEVDGVYIKQWVSDDIARAGAMSPPEVTGLGRYGSGQHEFLAYLNPGSVSADHIVNTVDIE